MGVNLQLHNLGFAYLSMESWISGVPPHKILYNRSGCGARVAPMMWNSKGVMDVFSNFGCYFGFMQISAHKLKGTGALLHLTNQTPS